MTGAELLEIFRKAALTSSIFDGRHIVGFIGTATNAESIYVESGFEAGFDIDKAAELITARGGELSDAEIMRRAAAIITARSNEAGNR